MTERKYSVAELDQLRVAIKNKLMFGRYVPKGQTFCMGSPQDYSSATEEKLRTHMLAGHVVQDLYDSEKETR